MQSAVVVFNPMSGSRRKRDHTIQQLLSALKSAGVKTQAATTSGPNQSRGALFKDLEPFDTILICGGDGTVNEVIQTLMQERREVPFGVIPFGTANYLAKELGMQRGDMEALVETLMNAEPQPCSVACAEQMDTGTRRYWLAAAGVGADARAICALTASAKARYGIAAYYSECMRQIVFSPRFPLFAAEFRDEVTGLLRTEVVAQVVAERIGHFGSFLEPQGSPMLAPDQLRVVLFKTARRSAFIKYGLCVVGRPALRGRQTTLDHVEVVRTRELKCYAIEAARPNASVGATSLAEVDGELFGELPVRLFVAESQLSILNPHSAALRRNGASGELGTNTHPSSACA